MVGDPHRLRLCLAPLQLGVLHGVDQGGPDVPARTRAIEEVPMLIGRWVHRRAGAAETAVVAVPGDEVEQARFVGRWDEVKHAVRGLINITLAEVNLLGGYPILLVKGSAYRKLKDVH
ncbi:MAG TPA: hypothetical protein VEL69_02025 [Ktedonobacteraceae bacterium]|nr:hypothetical protein [Ktedonobacteraceae bacterium]